MSGWRWSSSIGAVLLGLAISVATYVAASTGGWYVVCSGAIVGGVAMALRGRSLVARARVLDED